MKAQMLILLGAVIGGVALGWLTAPASRPQAMRAQETLAPTHASAEVRDARERLVQLDLVPPPMVEQGPPPVDVAALFRRDLTAIEDRANGRLVLIVDPSQPHGRRTLSAGDVYQDGWRVTRIEPQSVVLRRGREVRTVDVFALPVIEP
jgi:hypothetical protein